MIHAIVSPVSQCLNYQQPQQTLDSIHTIVEHDNPLPLIEQTQFPVVAGSRPLCGDKRLSIASVGNETSFVVSNGQPVCSTPGDSGDSTEDRCLDSTNKDAIGCQRNIAGDSDHRHEVDCTTDSCVTVERSSAAAAVPVSIGCERQLAPAAGLPASQHHYGDSAKQLEPISEVDDEAIDDHDDDGRVKPSSLPARHRLERLSMLSHYAGQAIAFKLMADERMERSNRPVVDDLWTDAECRVGDEETKKTLQFDEDDRHWQQEDMVIDTASFVGPDDSFSPRWSGVQKSCALADSLQSADFTHVTPQSSVEFSALTLGSSSTSSASRSWPTMDNMASISSAKENNCVTLAPPTRVTVPCCLQASTTSDTAVSSKRLRFAANPTIITSNRPDDRAQVSHHKRRTGILTAHTY